MNLDEGVYYKCQKCMNRVFYTMRECSNVVYIYGHVFCRWCIGNDKNGMLKKKE